MPVHHNNTPPDTVGVWVIVPLEPAAADPTSPPADWQSAFHIIDKNGTLTISELRILPTHPRTTIKPGAFEIALAPGAEQPWFNHAAQAAIPAGGITARALRDIRLGHALQQARRALLEINAAHDGRLLTDASPDRHGLTRALLAPRPDPTKRLRLEDSDLAILAATYLDAINAGSTRPCPDTAHTLGAGWTRDRVRDRLHEARRRHIITTPPHGKAGGELTDKGRLLLAKPPPPQEPAQ